MARQCAIAHPHVGDTLRVAHAARARCSGLPLAWGQPWAHKLYQAHDVLLFSYTGPKRRYLGGDDMKKGPEMPPDDMKKKESPPQVVNSPRQPQMLPRQLTASR